MFSGVVSLSETTRAVSSCEPDLGIRTAALTRVSPRTSFTDIGSPRRKPSRKNSTRASAGPVLSTRAVTSTVAPGERIEGTSSPARSTSGPVNSGAARTTSPGEFFPLRPASRSMSPDVSRPSVMRTIRPGYPAGTAARAKRSAEATSVPVFFVTRADLSNATSTTGPGARRAISRTRASERSSAGPLMLCETSAATTIASGLDAGPRTSTCASARTSSATTSVRSAVEAAACARPRSVTVRRASHHTSGAAARSHSKPGWIMFAVISHRPSTMVTEPFEQRQRQSHGGQERPEVHALRPVLGSFGRDRLGRLEGSEEVRRLIARLNSRD